MAIEVYRPNLPRAFEEMEDLMDRWMANWPLGRTWRRTNGHVWAPPIEVIEEKEHYLVKAELPGVKSEDVDISVSDNTITIKGERKESFGVKNEDVQFSEMINKTQIIPTVTNKIPYMSNPMP